MAMKVHSSRASAPRPANPIQLGLIPQMFHAVQDSLTFTDSNLASGPIGHPKPNATLVHAKRPRSVIVTWNVVEPDCSRFRDCSRHSAARRDAWRPIRQPLFLTPLRDLALWTRSRILAQGHLEDKGTDKGCRRPIRPRLTSSRGEAST